MYPWHRRSHVPFRVLSCHFIIDVLLKIGKGPGALGLAKSILGVVEAQGRGGLHLHAVIHGILAMLNVSRFANDPECMEAYRKMVDSLHTGEVDLTNWNIRGVDA